jgi:hypothetical protein
MLESTRVKKNSTRRLVAVFVDAAGAAKTGLTVTVRILRASDDQYLKNDGTWTAAPSTEYGATAWDGTNMPGVYCFDFTLPDVIDQYFVRFDGSTGAANRYQYAWLEAVRLNEEDLHKAKAALVNKQKQSISTGVVTILDDDGTTALMTLTPSVDDVDNPAENILTPG